MTPREQKIREDLRSGWMDVDDALWVVKRELETNESASLLILQAVLIQLSSSGSHGLDDARRCLERAIELAPDDGEAYEALGRFYDSAEPDRVKAEMFYRLALAKGAGEECQQALDELLAQ